MIRNRKQLTRTWWNATESDVARDIFGTVEHLRTITANRRAAERSFWEQYTNFQVTGLEGLDKMDIRFNLIAQAIDTAAAQLVKVYKPMYITTDADFSLQRKARKLTQITEGQFDDLQCDREISATFIDAAVTGTGHIFGYLDSDSKPKIERCLPGSVLVDPRDGQREDPRVIYYRVPVAREVLLEQYPDKTKIIEGAAEPTTSDRADLWLSTDSTVDDVMVIYAYLKGTKKAPGRFVVAVSTGALVDTDWTQDLPFVTYRWKSRPGSYYGLGIAEAGRLSQARYRKLEATVERMQDLGSTAWVISDKANKVRVEKLSNQPYSIVEYEGGSGAPPPTMKVFSGTPPDLIAEQERIRSQFLAEQGISEMSAQGVKPAGLNSAVSQRTYQEITQTRQKNQAKRFENFSVDIFRLLLQLNTLAAKQGDQSYKLMSKTSRGRESVLSELDWNEVELPENSYRIRCAPVSDISDGPAGRMELVSEWIASGMTSRHFAQNMLMGSSLDTDATSRLELADLDKVMFDIEQLEDGREVAPDPYVKPDLAFDVARLAYLHRTTQNIPEEILSKLRLYVDQCLELKNQAAPQPAPEGAPMEAQ